VRAKVAAWPDAACILRPMQRRDTPIFGFLVGLVTLLAGLTIVYVLLYYSAQGMSLDAFLGALRYTPDQAAKVLSLALIAEIIPITWVKRRRLDGAARGMFVVIMLTASLILWLKFVA
jgi:amino acid permease